MIYPPFCDICTVGFSSVNDRLADSASSLFLEMISNKIREENVTMPLRVLGPSRCVFEKINGRFRYRIIIKCRNNAEFRRFISDIWLKTFKMKEFSDVQTYIDINGDIGL